MYKVYIARDVYCSGSSKRHKISIPMTKTFLSDATLRKSRKCDFVTCRKVQNFSACHRYFKDHNITLIHLIKVSTMCLPSYFLLICTWLVIYRKLYRPTQLNKEKLDISQNCSIRCIMLSNSVAGYFPM